MHRPHSKNKAWTNSENSGKESNNNDSIAEDPNLPGNRWKHLQVAREEEREYAIANKLMPDPEARYRLDEAITIKGTCEDMCPELERHEREAKALLDPWEYIGGPQSKDKPKRVDHKCAVKCYQRGSGDSVVPSELRTPAACLRTIEYLFNLLNDNTLPATHAFVRDRSRAVRLDLRVQQIEDELAMIITERCARFHIISLHALRQLPKDKFDFGTEAEQIGQTLQSLKQFPSPFSLDERSEFLGYYILFHIRNEPPSHNPQGEKSFVLQFARLFREEVRKASPAFAKRSELKVSEEGVALFLQFAEGMISGDAALSDFAEAGKTQKWRRSVVYLVSSLLEYHFGEGAVSGMEERRADLSDLDIIQCDESSTGVTGDSKKTLMNGSTSSLDPQATPFVSSFGSKGAPTNGITSTSLAQPKPQPPAPSFDAFSGGAFVPRPSPFGTSSATSAFLQPTTSSPQPNAFGIVTSTSTSPQPQTSAFSVQPSSNFPFSSSSTSTTQAQKAANSFGFSSGSIPVNAFGGSGSSSFGFGTGSAFGGSFLSATTAKMNQKPEPQSQVPTPSQQQQSSFMQINVPQPPAAAPTPSLPFSLAPPVSTSQPGSALPFSITPAPTPPQPTQTVRFSASQGSNFPSFAPTTSPIPPVAEIPPPVKPVLGMFSDSIAFTGTAQSASLSSTSFPSTSTTTTEQLPKSPTVRQTRQPKGNEAETPLPGPDSRKGWATDFSEMEFKHLLQSAFAAMLAETLAKESYERMVRRQLKACFNRWVKLATDRCQRKMEKLDRERKRAEEWNARQKEAAANGIVINGISNLKRNRMGSVLISPVGGEAHHSGGRQVKRKLITSIAKSAVEIGEEVKKRGELRQKHWEPGTFLESIKEKVLMQSTARGSTRPPDWSVILSTNTLNPTSAGWLRVKFGLEYESKSSIGKPSTLTLEGREKDENHPGLVVFECSYLEPTLPPEERSRILTDDTSRLLLILKTLPRERHYMTRLIIIVWTSDLEVTREPSLPMPILSTIERLNFGEYAVVTFGGVGDPTDAFQKALRGLTLDVIGAYLKTLSVYELFNVFLKPWRKAVEDEVPWCRDIDKYNWPLAGYVMKAFLSLLGFLTAMASNITEEYSEASFEPPKLPGFESAKCTIAGASIQAMISYCEQIEEDDTNGAHDLIEALHQRKVALENNENISIMDFLGGASQIVKDVSERRALHFEVSLGSSRSPSIRIVRTRLQDAVASFEQRIKEMQAELVAVRQSLAAAHWALVESSSSIASQPPSSLRSLSVESTTPPPMIHTPPLFGTITQEPLTLKDLRPPSPPSFPTNGSTKLAKANTNLNGVHIRVNHLPSTNTSSSLSSSVSASSLRSKALEVLAKYKNKSPLDGQLPAKQSPFQTQSQQSSIPGGRVGTPPRDRHGPYDQITRVTKRRFGKTDILERHAHDIRDNFRSSVADDDDDEILRLE